MRKMIYVMCAVCAMCFAGFGQTAKVIALSKEDAARAKQIHEDLDRAQKALADLQTEISTRYLQVDSGKDRIEIRFKDGWSAEFEYSEDWLYIVPKRESPAVTGGTGTLTATGTACWPYNVTPSIANPGWSLNVVPMGTITSQ